jgi:hypothetical protein
MTAKYGLCTSPTRPLDVDCRGSTLTRTLMKRGVVAFRDVVAHRVEWRARIVCSAHFACLPSKVTGRSVPAIRPTDSYATGEVAPAP